jgi:pyruvate dehydrogenase E2 component (dihydrolipoamide acetyltransferase)
MSTLREVRVPDLGEGVDSGTVIALRVRHGDLVRAEQALLELETDKVTLEIPSPSAGRVVEIHCGENDQLQPNAIIVVLEVAAGDAELSAAVAPLTTSAERVALTTKRAGNTVPPVPSRVIQPLGRLAFIPAGPAARREARQLGVDIREIAASGPRGRITKEDVRAHVRLRMSGASAVPNASALPELPNLAAFGSIRCEALTRMEQVTARNMTRSGTMIPQARIGRHADVGALEQMRRAYRQAQPDDAPPLTLTAILCKAVGSALHQFPRFNAAFDHLAQEIVYRDYCHIGVAVDTPRGLVVPVVRDVARASLINIAEQLQTLSRAARAGELAAESMRGAGFTISNLGSLGVETIHPLVNWPEVAILGVAAIDERLVQATDGLGTQLRLPLTLSFDHRIINGGDAARFLACIVAFLAEPEALLARL